MEVLIQNMVENPKWKSFRLKLKKYYKVQHPVYGIFLGRLTFLNRKNDYAEFEVIVSRVEYKFIPVALSSCKIIEN